MGRRAAVSAVENMRKIPRQSRAQASVDVVLEAAAQVLEAVDEAEMLE